MPIYRLPSPRNSSPGESAVKATTTTRTTEQHLIQHRSTQLASNTDVPRSKSLPDYNRAMGDKRNGRHSRNGGNDVADSETLIEREIREQMEKEAEVAALHSPRSSALLLPEPYEGIKTPATIYHTAATNGSELKRVTNAVGLTNTTKFRKPNETTALNYCVPPGGVLTSTGVRRNPSAYSQKVSGSVSVSGSSEVKANVSNKQRVVSLYNESEDDVSVARFNKGLAKSVEALVIDRSAKTSHEPNRSTISPQQLRQIPPSPPTQPPPLPPTQPPPLPPTYSRQQQNWQSFSLVVGNNNNNNYNAINNSIAKNSINSSASSISAASRLPNEDHSRIIQREMKPLNNLESSTSSSTATSHVQQIGNDKEFDDDGEFRLHSFVPQSETPIEKEIRLLRQREGSLRRARGFTLQLPPDDDRRNDVIEIPYVVPIRGTISGLFDGNGEIGSEAVSSDPSMRRLASSRLRHEMLAERERELDLRRQGKISTISEERIDLQPVMRSVHVAQPSTSASLSTSTENVGRLASNYQFNSLPKGANSNHVSSATAYHKNNANHYKSTAFTSDGKIPQPTQRPSSHLLLPQSYERPALPNSDPPGFTSVNLLPPGDSQTSSVVVTRTASSNGGTSSRSNVERPSWRTSAEQIIEEELKEMKRREEELALV